MGAYASTANTTKLSEDGVVDSLPYGASEMQGWRKTMEDAHIASAVPAEPADADRRVCVFGVFDGHGGREVAEFVKRHFTRTLPELPAWPTRDISTLLHQAFLRMDELLVQPAHQPELHELRTAPPPMLVRGPSTGEHIGGGEQDPVVEDATQMLKAMLALKRSQMMAEGGGPLGRTGAAAAAAAAEMGAAAASSGADANGGAPGTTSPPPSSAGADAAQPPPSPPAATAPGVGGGAPPGHVLGGADAIDPSRWVNAGCTAIVACVFENALYVANAGDSRGVLCRGGETVALSVDHKPTDEPERMRIVSAGGWVTDAGRVNGNLNLSRSMGDLKYKADRRLPPEAQVITAAPDVRKFELEESDEFFVLACDGVWDCKSNEEVISFVRTRLAQSPPPKLSAIAEALFDECISRDPTETAGIGGDNMTCMIVRLR